MNTSEIVKELVEAAGKLGLEIRYETGGFRGGRCSVSGHNIIVLNKRQPVESHLAILGESLNGLPTDTIFLTPTTRNALRETIAGSSSPEPLLDVE